ncbi:MAG: hypothetical protein JO036_09595 [Candidatus Eremiobacteraeota bacterium]|nr:hypothetical protein [Candidatus Eremiobacteraeota bacterium]
MHAPSADELAAIAVAYLAVTARNAPPPRVEASRWALAGRIGFEEPAEARFVSGGSRSRWNVAGRLDG